MAPLISIITINYNNKDGLKKTLDSVRSQNFSDFEHIIIDGGSTDGSVDEIKEFALDSNYGKHLTWWSSEKDSGIYNAINKGISHASGFYVYVLNSGDFLVNGALDLVWPYLKNKEEIVFYGAIDGYRDSNYKVTICHSADDLYKSMFPHQAVFTPLSLHKKYGVYNEKFRIAADREFMVRLSKNNVAFAHIPVIVCNYSLEGISSTNTKLVFKENLVISNSFIPAKKLRLKKIKSVLKCAFELLFPGLIKLPVRFVFGKLKALLRNIKARGVT